MLRLARDAAPSAAAAAAAGAHALRRLAPVAARRPFFGWAGRGAGFGFLLPKSRAVSGVPPASADWTPPTGWVALGDASSPPLGAQGGHFIAPPLPRSVPSAERGPFRFGVLTRSETELADEKALREHVLAELATAPRTSMAPSIARKALLEKLPLETLIQSYTQRNRASAESTKQSSASLPGQPHQVTYFALLEKAKEKEQETAPRPPGVSEHDEAFSEYQREIGLAIANGARYDEAEAFAWRRYSHRREMKKKKAPPPLPTTRGPFIAVKNVLTQRDWPDENSLRAHIAADLRRMFMETGHPRTLYSEQAVRHTPLNDLLEEWLDITRSVLDGSGSAHSEIEFREAERLAWGQSSTAPSSTAYTPRPLTLSIERELHAQRADNTEDKEDGPVATAAETSGVETWRGPAAKAKTSTPAPTLTSTATAARSSSTEEEMQSAGPVTRSWSKFQTLMDRAVRSSPSPSTLPKKAPQTGSSSSSLATASTASKRGPQQAAAASGAANPSTHADTPTTKAEHKPTAAASPSTPSSSAARKVTPPEHPAPSAAGEADWLKGSQPLQSMFAAALAQAQAKSQTKKSAAEGTTSEAQSAKQRQPAEVEPAVPTSKPESAADKKSPPSSPAMAVEPLMPPPPLSSPPAAPAEMLPHIWAPLALASDDGLEAPQSKATKEVEEDVAIQTTEPTPVSAAADAPLSVSEPSSDPSTSWSAFGKPAPPTAATPQMATVTAQSRMVASTPRQQHLLDLLHPHVRRVQEDVTRALDEATEALASDARFDAVLQSEDLDDSAAQQARLSALVRAHFAERGFRMLGVQEEEEEERNDVVEEEDEVGVEEAVLEGELLFNARPNEDNPCVRRQQQLASERMMATLMKGKRSAMATSFRFHAPPTRLSCEQDADVLSGEQAVLPWGMSGRSVEEQVASAKEGELEQAASGDLVLPPPSAMLHLSQWSREGTLQLERSFASREELAAFLREQLQQQFPQASAGAALTLWSTAGLVVLYRRVMASRSGALVWVVQRPTELAKLPTEAEDEQPEQALQGPFTMLHRRRVARGPLADEEAAVAAVAAPSFPEFVVRRFAQPEELRQHLVEALCAPLACHAQLPPDQLPACCAAALADRRARLGSLSLLSLLRRFQQAASARQEDVRVLQGQPVLTPAQELLIDVDDLLEQLQQRTPEDTSR